MLPFHELIVSDLLDDPGGGLVVLSSGLSLPSLIAALVRLHHPSAGSLLLLSASDSQKSSILSLLPSSLVNSIPGDLPAHHRAALYASGAALFVSPRILISDLLTSRVPPHSLAGLLLLNAHRISDTSTESFIARILRSASPAAYIRAFSDRPDSVASGFSKAERIIKSLFIRRLHLWPRFHVQVSTDLERSPPEVIDVRVPVTPAMRGIQTAVLEAMDACLKELRRTNKVDVEDLTVENGLFKSFDEIVRRQLDPIWHTIGKKAKQLVSDLRTLRKLLDYLVRYDAVAYLRYLDTLRVSEGVRSIWIFADSSHRIFELAKKRVYQVVRADGVRIGMESRSPASKKRKSTNVATKSEKEGEVSHSINTNPGVVLDEVLEEAPKWKVLRELLEEIEEDRRKQSLIGGRDLGNEGNDSGFVLVVCKDERSCLQLEDCITKGAHQVMRAEWEKYLLSKAELHGLRKRKKKRSNDPKGIGVLAGDVSTTLNGNTEPSSMNKLENDALLAAASEISHLDTEEIVVGESSGLRTRSGQAGKGRGRGRGRWKGRGRGRGRGSGRGRTGEVVGKVQDSENGIEKATNNDETEDTSCETKQKEKVLERKDASDSKEKALNDSSVDKGVLEKNEQGPGMSELTDAKPLPPVQFYALESDRHILDVWKPSVIVVYHPNMTFVREIEIYKAENPSRQLKVYFLFYEESTEVQKFEASIRRENSAFESLIRQKSLMMIPVDLDEHCIGSSASGEPQSLASQNSITRKAGGRKAPEKEMQVIVDMREFNSSLPNVLHQRGMKIIPVVLEVGDYVLSPLICVERKSIADLYQSFASGRLYNQVETMGRYYKMPVLLIEFSQDKSFSFQSESDIGDDVSPTSIISKLSLLVLHFPRLRLVWSRSVHATAEIFASLKTNQDEPDVSKASRVGVPSEDGTVEDDVRAENYNTSAIEFLRRLPGVTDSNYRPLMDGCRDLAELALLPVERLAELMGGQKAARTLKEFLDAKCPTMF